MQLKTTVVVLVSIALGGCIDGSDGGEGAEGPSAGVPAGTTGFDGDDEYPPPEGTPCDLEYHSLSFTMHDTRNGTHQHTLQVMFNDVTIGVNTTLGRGVSTVLRGYGSFRVDFLQSVPYEWTIDGVAESGSFEPVCHPRGGFVDFRSDEDGRTVEPSRVVA